MTVDEALVVAVDVSLADALDDTVLETVVLTELDPVADTEVLADVVIDWVSVEDPVLVPVVLWLEVAVLVTVELGEV